MGPSWCGIRTLSAYGQHKLQSKMEKKWKSNQENDEN